MSTKQEDTERQTLISVSLPPVIVAKIDKLSGDIPRSAYLRKRIIAIVEAEEKGVVNA